jgi:hypothetical protein
VDYWLSGRGKRDNVPGVVNDYFIPHKRQIKYLKEYHVWLAFDSDKIVGWAVKTHLNILIHVLIAGNYRSKGIGRELVIRLNPQIIRSKTDQSTGNPEEFYHKCGYEKLAGEMTGKNKNIQLFCRGWKKG